MKTIFIDVDTTGLSVIEDRIVKINLIQQDNEQSKKVSILLNPGKEISKEATAIHGLTNSMVQNESSFFDIKDTLYQILDTNQLVGYNIKSFDLPILIQHFKQEKISLNVPLENIIDLKEVYLKKEPRNLKGALSFYTDKEYISDVVAMAQIYTAQKEKYKVDLNEITTDSSQIDLANKFIKSNTGDIIYTFGKYKNKTINYVDNNDPGYNSWVLESSMFQETTKDILRKYSRIKV